MDPGLPQMRIRPYTDSKFKELPHVILTIELEWDPSVLGFDLHGHEDWYNTLNHVEDKDGTNIFIEFGKYCQRVVVQCTELFMQADTNTIEDNIDQCVYHGHAHHVEASLSAYATRVDNNTLASSTDSRSVSTCAPDYTALCPMFGWLDPKIIEKTFELSTQLACLPMGTMLKRAFKSANPALNVICCSEPVACDIVYADTPAEIFVGFTFKVTDMYGIKTDKQFINTLEDNIREQGAPSKLISDQAQVEISEKVKSILCTLFIGEWQSKSHQQQQNPAECHYKTVKAQANVILDRTGAPEYTWLLALQYTCFLLNHCYDSTISAIPLSLHTGLTINTSIILRFSFYKKVYFQRNETKFPSGSKEALGYMVGFADHVGNALCYKILTDDMMKILYRSQLSPCNEDNPNLRVDPPDREISDNSPIRPVIQSVTERPIDVVQEDNATASTLEPGSSIDALIFGPEDLMGRTFLLNPKDNSTIPRACIVEFLKDYESKLHNNPTRIKFRCALGNEGEEEMITYAKLLNYLQQDTDNPLVYWKFCKIISHQNVERNHPDYNGFSINIIVEWENGEQTVEPLAIIAESNPVTCALYAKNNNLLNKPGWKCFKRMAKKEGKFLWQVNKAKLKSYK
jgi:hypothetical protein